MTYDYCILSDSVEEGEKIVNAALDKFGRIGETIQYSSIYVTNLFAKSDIFLVKLSHMLIYMYLLFLSRLQFRRASLLPSSFGQARLPTTE